MVRIRRLRAFVRDIFTELPLVWSLARTHDCERNGGHRWHVEQRNVWIAGEQTRVCTRCGVSETVPLTTTTGGTYRLVFRA